MQQAILLDVSLLLCSFLGQGGQYITSQFFNPSANLIQQTSAIPPELVAQGAEGLASFVFLLTLGCVAYCTTSNAFGKEPDKIPILSERTKAVVDLSDMDKF
jgi:hypothetical protein